MNLGYSNFTCDQFTIGIVSKKSSQYLVVCLSYSFSYISWKKPSLHNKFLFFVFLLFFLCFPAFSYYTLCDLPKSPQTKGTRKTEKKTVSSHLINRSILNNYLHQWSMCCLHDERDVILLKCDMRRNGKISIRFIRKCSRNFKHNPTAHVYNRQVGIGSKFSI